MNFVRERIYEKPGFLVFEHTKSLAKIAAGLLQLHLCP